ncbi:hypothetical protein OAZ07_00300 [Pelagibacteraceae bacterium]|nr:hypothetical protein [Pelagibacteraceae bacterium]
MKLGPLNILLSKNFNPDKKFYFISGNEITLMEKVKSKIIKKYQHEDSVEIKHIDSINDFVDEAGLFENKNICLVKDYKGLDKESLNNVRNSLSNFIFLQQNSTKIKKIKNLFNTDSDSYLIDCYELDKDSKIKILNEFLKENKLNISQEVYWYLIDRSDNRYIFFENNLLKILQLGNQNITLKNIRKLLIVDDSGKEKIFFKLLKKNKEIIEFYREKIINGSDVNDLYYYCKYFCQLIIDCRTEDEYNKKIPIYLFREKNFLVDVYRKYNSKKKQMLLKLLFSTERKLRKESGLSLVTGLRFILSVKQITIS